MSPDARSTMAALLNAPVWQSMYAHTSTTAVPRPVAVGFPHADQVRSRAVMSSVLQITSIRSGATAGLVPHNASVTGTRSDVVVWLHAETASMTAIATAARARMRTKNI